MADAFQPKFADLVRNYTTSSGTDDFVLGPAVNGFASFADTCAVGDRFYYSAIGIDNPGDTETGRGTLLAGGAIGRDPFSGKKTNFKSGTKAVALVAAAEWFSEVDALRSSGAGMLNVKAFGALGDSDINGSTGTDDTAAIQAAIDAIGALGGGTLYVPDGYYKVSSFLTLVKSLRIVLSAGAMIVATHAGGGGTTAGENLRNGSLFYGNWPSNSSTPAHIVIEGGTLRCPNLINEGAAFYDNCGTSIRLRGVRVYGFKYSVVLDQSELVDITECDIGASDSGGACIWIVNGNTLTPGNQGTFTNRISVQRCQINAGSSVYGILDDGGVAHAFSDNNYNGCLNHIRAAGVLGLMIRGGEFESAVGPCIWLDFTLLDGVGVGGNSLVHIDGSAIVPVGGQPCIRNVGAGAGSLMLTAPFFGNTTSAKVVGTGGISALYSVGVQSGGGGPTFDQEAQNHWEVGNDGSAMVFNSTFPLAVEKLDVAGPLTASNIGSAAARSESDFLQPANNLSEVESVLAAAKNLRSCHVLAQSAEPISHTGDTAEFTLATINVPANAMGPNGRIEIDAEFSMTNNPNTKTMTVKLGSTSLATRTLGNVGLETTRAVISNRNSQSAQSGKALWFNGSGSFTNNAISTGAEDTTAPLNLLITGQLSNAADTITLESYQVVIYPDEAA